MCLHDCGLVMVVMLVWYGDCSDGGMVMAVWCGGDGGVVMMVWW